MCVRGVLVCAGMCGVCDMYLCVCNMYGVFTVCVRVLVSVYVVCVCGVCIV